MPRHEGRHVIFHQTWVEEGLENRTARNGGLQSYTRKADVGHWQDLSTREHCLLDFDTNLVCNEAKSHHTYYLNSSYLLDPARSLKVIHYSSINRVLEGF